MSTAERTAPDAQYEPFGEPAGAGVAPCAQAPLSPLQRAVSRAGVGLFWTLVAGIVLARAVLFAPHGLDGLVASAAQAVRSALGWA